jgi:glycosidase
VRRLGALLALAATSLGCGGEQAPRRDCFARVWVAPGAPDALRVIGSWDDWASPGLIPLNHDDGWRLLRLSLPPGDHGYLLVDGEGSHIDPQNALSTWRGEQEVSLLQVPNCAEPGLIVDRVEVSADAIEVEVTFLASDSGEAFDPSAVFAETRDGIAASVVQAIPEQGKLVVRAQGLPAGKVNLGLALSDASGGRVQTFTSGWTRAATGAVGQRDRRDEIVYQVVIDRFRGDGGAPLSPPPTPGSRAGGTLDGVRSAIDDGTFAELGITTLWLSPVYTNPVAPQLGSDGRMYEGYHGYWPVESRGVEPRIGGDEALDELVARAHDDGLAVVLDVVPNHVFEDNPRFAEHPEWFGEPGCICGTPSCPWNEHILSCWFTPYLPDVRWQNDAAMQATLDDIIWWTERFDLDGYRVDAVPMMPRATTRRIADRLRRHTQPAEATLLLGEVFTGPGIGALGQLRQHIGSAGLDSAFDFPLMWALQSAVASGKGSFGAVEALLQAEQELFGEEEVIARILDNHDTVRLLSVAQGDAFGDPWDEPATQPQQDEPYLRLMLAQAIVFTLPGMPVVYQGDEVGVAGGGDPDNRRVLPADASLLPIQQQLRARVAQLSRLRRCSTALRHGDREPLLVAPTRYAYRRGGAHPAIAVISTDETEADFTLPALGVEPGSWIDVASGETFEATGDPLAMTMPPLSLRILLRADDPCLGVW